MSEIWPTCELGTLFELRSEKSKQIKATEYLESGDLPVIDQSERSIAGYIDDHARAYSGRLPVIVFGDHTRATKFIDFPFGAGADGTQILAPIPQMDARFFYYVVSRSSLLIGNYGYDRHLKHLRRFKTCFPISVTEQHRIAEILSTLDEAIAQTEALIAKHQQIKAGLMHDLFTRGVTPDGKLRPPREQALELYQDTPIGWIPKGWQYELLDKLAVRGSGHTPNKNFPEYWNGGIKWISLADSYRLDRLYITDTEYEISQLGIQNSSATVHPAGIVVISRDAGIGKSAITTEPMAVSQHFMCWRCDARLDKYFLYYWLQFKKRMFENIAMGSTILTIGLPYFKRLKVSAPVDIEEQKMIGDSLLSADEKIFSLEADLEKKKQQKYGLMHDLLTGRVRVKVAEAEEEHI